MNGAIGQDEAVRVEVIVVRLVAVVSSIRPELFSIASLFSDSLVHPIPDKPAVCPGFRLKKVPILLEISGAVSHRVSVFNLEERPPFAVGVVVADDVLRFGIHGGKCVAMDAVARL